MKYSQRYFIIFLLFLSTPCLLRAQGIADVSLGFGTAKVGSNGLGIENINSPNAFGVCNPSPRDI